MYISGVRIVTISRENGLAGNSDVDIVDDGDEMTVGKGEVAADDEAGVVDDVAVADAVPVAELVPCVGDL